MGIAPESQASDGELLRALQGGDAGAFDVLFARHRRGIFAYVAAITRDAGLAEDVTQDCFLELVRRAGELDARRGVSGWLYRVARNRAIDVQRHRGYEVLAGDAALDAARDAAGGVAALRLRSGQATAAEDAEAHERAVAVAAGLARLPEAEREVLVLRYFSGLAFWEIAAAVGRPLGTVLWQAQRGLRRLKNF